MCVDYKSVWEKQLKDNHPTSYLSGKIACVYSHSRDPMSDQTRFITKHSKYRLFLDQEGKIFPCHDAYKGSWQCQGTWCAGTPTHHSCSLLGLFHFLFVCLFLFLVLHSDITLLGQSVIWLSLFQQSEVYCRGALDLGPIDDDNRYRVQVTKESSTVEFDATSATLGKVYEKAQTLQNLV